MKYGPSLPSSLWWDGGVFITTGEAVMKYDGTRHCFAPFSPSTWKSTHGPVWLSNNWTFMKLTNPELPSLEHNSISHTNASIFHMVTNTLNVLVHFVANQRKIVFCAICYFAKSCWQFCKISLITLSLHYSQWVTHTTYLWPSTLEQVSPWWLWAEGHWNHPSMVSSIM